MFLSSWRGLEQKCLGGRYVLQSLLGTGGFGAVFLAECVDDPAIACNTLNATVVIHGAIKYRPHRKPGFSRLYFPANQHP
ncbi:hypothetical protein H6G45_17895 [Synechocystis sp. FACHB-383]|uniref:hypothetical protein n=1 Tax=Synechocystis sp. FACHB-383 TaxID=2692864 RepID=UPI0016839387|nr:hypothetical protein [Synechocystis sp. FACHB-383]MBD2655321.1 hypothetical protein [Synechocystis sp. FACHB-383]